MKLLDTTLSNISINDTLQSYRLNVEGSKSIEVHADKHVNGSLYLELEGAGGDIVFTGEIKEGSNVNIILHNRCTGKVTMTQDVNVYKDASVELGYADVEDAELSYSATVRLLEEGANADYISVARVSGKRIMKVECVHEVPYTSSDVQNFALVNENGNYKMEVIGRIVKGAHGSACHQASRVLTTSPKQVSDVLPVLLIDENDVKASHATTVGQPDANQLYYLQSRGLTHAQALGLLTIGYLMPVTTIIADEELQIYLKEYIEKKVGIHV